MALTITDGSKSITFQYDADHNRVSQTEGTAVTYYLPDGELTPPNGSGAGGPVWHTYFMAGGQRVAENWGATASATNYGPATTLNRHYFHTDYQNTISLVTQDGYVYGNASNPTQDSADVFGVPRSANGTADPTWGANDASKRRYINQEDVTDAQLIDLNARLYDPRLAKSFSPDPVINDQGDSQSWNAYAYSHNNPMSREDPTGLACSSSGSSGGSSGNTTNCVTVKAPAHPPIVFIDGRHGPLAFSPRPNSLYQVVQRAYSGNRAAMYALNNRFIVKATATIPAGVDLSSDDAVANNIQITVNLDQRMEPLDGMSSSVAEFVGGTAGTAGAGGLGALRSALMEYFSALMAEAAEEAAPPAQVTLNRIAGNAFRDSLADSLRAAGRDVETEVYKSTPFGKRFIDIEASKDGQVLGGIETKVGSSPYTSLQQLKDWWLKDALGYTVNVERDR